MGITSAIGGKTYETSVVNAETGESKTASVEVMCRPDGMKCSLSNECCSNVCAYTFAPNPENTSQPHKKEWQYLCGGGAGNPNGNPNNDNGNGNGNPNGEPPGHDNPPGNSDGNGNDGDNGNGNGGRPDSPPPPPPTPSAKPTKKPDSCSPADVNSAINYFSAEAGTLLGEFNTLSEQSFGTKALGTGTSAAEIEAARAFLEKAWRMSTPDQFRGVVIESGKFTKYVRASAPVLVAVGIYAELIQPYMNKCIDDWNADWQDNRLVTQVALQYVEALKKLQTKDCDEAENNHEVNKLISEAQLKMSNMFRLLEQYRKNRDTVNSKNYYDTFIREVNSLRNTIISLKNKADELCKECKYKNVQPPSDRHYLNRLTISKEINSIFTLAKTKNEVLKIIESDLTEIKTCKAQKNGNVFYTTSGRTYEYERVGNTERVYPTGGPGVENLTRLEYSLLVEFSKTGVNAYKFAERQIDKGIITYESFFKVESIAKFAGFI